MAIVADRAWQCRTDKRRLPCANAPVRHEERGACLMETFFAAAAERLARSGDRAPGGGAALALLERLGFRLDELQTVPIGLFVDEATMADDLLAAGFTPAELEVAGLLEDPRLAGRLVGPIRGISGRMVGFWARHPRGEDPKYLYFTAGWHEDVVAYGLDLAVRARAAVAVRSCSSTICSTPWRSSRSACCTSPRW